MVYHAPYDAGDKWHWERSKQARALGMNEWELSDEPDNLASMAEENWEED